MLSTFTVFFVVYPMFVGRLSGIEPGFDAIVDLEVLFQIGTLGTGGYDLLFSFATNRWFNLKSQTLFPYASYPSIFHGYYYYMCFLVFKKSQQLF